MEKNLNRIDHYIHLGAWQRHSPTEIMLLVAQENYTEVYFTNGKKLLVATTLKKLEERFAHSTELFRTHKSYMVNMHYIKIPKQSAHLSSLILHNNQSILLSRRRKSAFLQKLSGFYQ